MSAEGKTARELAGALGVSCAVDRVLRRVSSIEAATADAVVFAQDETTLQAALASQAGLIIGPLSVDDASDTRVIRVKHPKYAFAVAAGELTTANRETFVHPSAHINGNVLLGEGTRVGAGAVIEADARVGRDCTIGSNATVCRGAVLGDRVVVQAGAVLGATGFGYVRNPESGEYLLFPQQGTLVIEDDVEIGANTTIDRGALGETRIGRGTKIDNLVHIAHNCTIGKNVVIAAQVGISGSCVVEDGAVLAGQVGLGDHCRVGTGVVMGGQSGVYPGKTVTGPGELFAGTPAEPVREHLKSLARLRRLK